MDATTAASSHPLGSPPPTILQLLRRVPLAYADARTWRALAHVVTGGPVALVAATLFTVGVASGLLSLVLIGLPLCCFALFAPAEFLAGTALAGRPPITGLVIR